MYAIILAFFFPCKNIAENHLMIGGMKQRRGYLLLLITSYISIYYKTSLYMLKMYFQPTCTMKPAAVTSQPLS